MSLILKFRHHVSNGSMKHICSPAVASRIFRHYSQTASMGYRDDDELVEIDQRLLPADYDPATFDPTNHRGPPSARVWSLVDQMCGLTLSEASELSSVMMEKFCFLLMKRLTMKERFEILARIRLAKAEAEADAGAAGNEENKAEKLTFELKMESYDKPSKLKIIKELRTFMSLGLKEAKDLVEKTPTVLKKGVLKDEAEKIIEQMKAVGANVIMV